MALQRKGDLDPRGRKGSPTTRSVELVAEDGGQDSHKLHQGMVAEFVRHAIPQPSKVVWNDDQRMRMLGIRSPKLGSHWGSVPASIGHGRFQGHSGNDGWSSCVSGFWLVVQWWLVRKARNRAMHPLHGNGPSTTSNAASREATKAELSSAGFDVSLPLR